MPSATARGVRRYIRFKGQSKAKDFQQILTEEWLEDNLRSVFL